MSYTESNSDDLKFNDCLLRVDLLLSFVAVSCVSVKTAFKIKFTLKPIMHDTDTFFLIRAGAILYKF